MDDRLSQIRHLYTDPDAMHAHLRAQATVRDALVEARYCLRIALDPRARFGLSARECVPVVPVIEATVRDALVMASPVADRVRALRGEGYSYDEVWGRIRGPLSLGFGRGDARLLGVE